MRDYSETYRKQAIYLIFVGIGVIYFVVTGKYVLAASIVLLFITGLVIANKLVQSITGDKTWFMN